jgi:hypothetical protein
MSSHVAILPALDLIPAIRGCSSDETPTPTATQTTTTAATTTTTTATTPPSTVATPTAPPLETAVQCPPRDGRQIQVTIGDISCSDGYAIAAKFDLQDGKVQQIDSFTCELGNAMTRPVIFTCVSAQAEFAVSEV